MKNTLRIVAATAAFCALSANAQSGPRFGEGVDLSGFNSPSYNQVVDDCGGILVTQRGSKMVFLCPNKRGRALDIGVATGAFETGIEVYNEARHFADAAARLTDIDKNIDVLLTNTRSRSRAKARYFNGRKVIRFTPDDKHSNNPFAYERSFIVAHEVAHFYLGHDVSGSPKPNDELEADEFAGLLLGYSRSHLSLSIPFSIEFFMNQQPREARGGYPSRRSRMAAATKGFERGQAIRCKNQSFC